MLATRLVAFYGQHEHRRLTIGAAQLAMVDGAAGLQQERLLGEYRESWKRHRSLGRELDDLLGRDQARERDLDLHRFELDEIDAAALIEGEKDGLAEERDRLRHAEGLREAAAGAATRLRGDEEIEGAAGLLAGARDSLSGLRGVDGDLDELAARVEGLALEIEDVGVELGRYLEGIEADPGRLGELEERLDLIDRLERKHGGSIESVLEHGAWCRDEIRRLEGGETREGELREEIAEAAEDLERSAAALSKARKKAARGLATKVTADLEELAMPGAELTIELPGVADGPGASGAESVEFMLAPNPGIPPQPLRDTASGG
jgi:DNA repair protein RecN (Recombination protein N)